MAYTTINKSGDYFNTKLYTGTGSSQGITGVGFKPDWVWIKQRSGSEQHVLFDAVRGIQKYISSNTTSVESTTATTLTAFNSDGFTQGGHGMTGQNGSTYSSWNWKANNYGQGYGDNNNDGSISSKTSKSVTAGFSIVTWTGDGSKSATVGHGLGSELSCIIIRERTGTDWWHNWSKGLSSNSHNVFFNNTNEERSPAGDGHVKKLDNTSTFGFDSSTTNVNAVNENGINNVAYCFAEKTGYSKFGSYVGNGNADGTFVYTGFKPAFVMMKSYSNTESWIMKDVARDTFNPVEKNLAANSASSEAGWGTSYDIDILSNGFKMRDASGQTNGNGYGFIYMAFAEAPLVGSNNVPCTAR